MRLVADSGNGKVIVECPIVWGSAHPRPAQFAMFKPSEAKDKKFLVSVTNASSHLRNNHDNPMSKIFFSVRHSTARFRSASFAACNVTTRRRSLPLFCTPVTTTR